jgi:hypothetical protein
MPAIRTGRIEFASGTGSRTFTQMVWFPGQTIRECHVGLAGYRAAYTSGDHELKALEVGLRCSQETSEFGIGVQVAATLHLRDKNGDDPFQGFIDYVLFVELDPPSVAFNPRVLDLRLVIQ